MTADTTGNTCYNFRSLIRDTPNLVFYLEDAREQTAQLVYAEDIKFTFKCMLTTCKCICFVSNLHDKYFSTLSILAVEMLYETVELSRFVSY